MLPTFWVFIAFLAGLVIGGLAVWRWLPAPALEPAPEPAPEPAAKPSHPAPAEEQTAAPEKNEIAAYLDANQRVVEELQRKYGQGPPPDPEVPRKRAPRPRRKAPKDG